MVDGPFHMHHQTLRMNLVHTLDVLSDVSFLHLLDHYEVAR